MTVLSTAQPATAARLHADAPPLRVLLVGNFELDRQESMLRFRRLLETALPERGQRVETWSPTPAITRLLPNYRYDGFAKLCGYFDKFVLFPRRVRRRLASARVRGSSPDVIHILDHANAVYAPSFAGHPLLATCHDLLQIRSALGEFPEHPLTPRGQKYQRWILRRLATVPHVACISSQTARDFLRLTGRPESSATVVFNGLNYPFAPVPHTEATRLLADLLRARQLPSDTLAHGGCGFLLNIGGGQWYKNRPGLLALYAELRARWPEAPRLALVGKPLVEPLLARARALGIAEHLIHLGRVDGPQLSALYSTAEAMIFPSLYEGFGWPIAEAQTCGCPVFTSNRAPMTEVGGDAAVYLDPQDPTASAATLLRAWPMRDTMRQRGLARAALFDTGRMVDEYLMLYRRLAAASRA